MTDAWANLPADATGTAATGSAMTGASVTDSGTATTGTSATDTGTASTGTAATGTGRSATGLDVHLVLDPRRKTDSLEAALRELIRDGRLAAGTRMPATRGLAADLGIARNSVAEVYGRLIGEGWLEARTGAGTWVAAGPVAVPAAAAGLAAADPADAANRVAPVARRDVAAAPRLDLRAGIPDTSAFPRSAWASAMRRAVSTAPVAQLEYGLPAGLAPLRRALSSYLGRARGVVADHDRVHVTHGAGHAIHLVGAALTAAGARRIAVEEYGHRQHRDILRSVGLEVVPVPVDEAGAAIERLDELRVDGVLLTPAHQFPTGVPLSPARRTAVVQWAERTGGLVIEDDYDGEFRFDRRAVGALQSLSPDHVVYVGTASKSLGPAVGLGWCVLPGRLVAAVAEERRRDGANPGALTQLALAEFLARGDYDRAVRGARVRYRTRRQHLHEQVERRLTGARLTGMAAGLQCLLELPAGIREQEVTGRAASAGLELAGLATFRADEAEHPAAGGTGTGGAGHPPAMVVGFGAPPAHRFEEAVDAAVHAVESVVAGR
jgi:GntR family transcriptional regulator/MocR family aminotransferase